MTPITEDYCSYEIAKLLKEKGFREYCEAIYFILENEDYRWSKIDIPIRDCSTCKPAAILCPTHQMAMKWLREKHNIDIFIRLADDYVKYGSEEPKYTFSIDCPKKCIEDIIFYPNDFEKFEVATEVALLYVLKNII